MSGQDKDDLSRFFRKATQKPEIKFNENDWTKLEAMLDKASAEAVGSSKRFRRKFIVAGIITLTVLSTASYFIARQPSSFMQSSNLVSSVYSTQDSNTSITSNKPNKLSAKAALSPEAMTLESNTHREIPASLLRDNKPDLKSLPYRQPPNVFDASTRRVDRLTTTRQSSQKIGASRQSVDTTQSTIQRDNSDAIQQKGEVSSHEVISDEHPVVVTETEHTAGGAEVQKISSSDETDQPAIRTALGQRIPNDMTTTDRHATDSASKLVIRTLENDSAVVSNDHANGTDKQLQQSRWSILLSLAPDFSSNDFQHITGPGESFGISGYYRIAPKLNVFVGVSGSNKKYVSYGKEYKPKEDHYWSKHTNGIAPTEIDGSCFMLEIPVGIQYAALNMKKNRVLVSGMLSNYTMFNESYTYVFPSENPGAAQGWKSKKTTSYPFSVAGLSISFEHDLSSRIAIGFAPYMKIPLRDMGTWTTMKLYTVGGALTLRYTFQKAKIPIVQPRERSD